MTGSTARSAGAPSRPPVPCAIPQCGTPTRAGLRVAGFPHEVPLCASHWRGSVERYLATLKSAPRTGLDLEGVAGMWLDRLSVAPGALGPEAAR